ncbi:hypothetical protein NPIL_61611 [Nephila pilipes]|uniref:Uncharacterized protein n=1 Tax=Nephila pilipes TaxID=299642 RepID=A0A8X6NNE5_NEPPI|nr:hypothetical protein NPIL_61611 [Nephila pilipes]
MKRVFHEGFDYTKQTITNSRELRCSICRGKKVFKTAEEAVEYLFSEELESEMIVLPPEVDEFTDEEGFDDSETLDHL